MEDRRGLERQQMGVEGMPAVSTEAATELAENADTAEPEIDRAAMLRQWRRRGFLSRCASPSQRLIARRLPQLGGDTPHRPHPW